MEYLNVTNKINQITSKVVMFSTDDKNEVHLLRKHKALVIWKLNHKGIFVLREYAEAYKLDTK
jgi:hypothetical protein